MDDDNFGPSILLRLLPLYLLREEVKAYQARHLLGGEEALLDHLKKTVERPSQEGKPWKKTSDTPSQS